MGESITDLLNDLKDSIDKAGIAHETIRLGGICDYTVSEKITIAKQICEEILKKSLSNREFNIGDKVICFESGFIIGEVIRFYTPTSCEEQTLVKTTDGQHYHAPTRAWKPYVDGVSPSHIICDGLIKD